MWQKENGIMLGAVRHNDKTSIAHIFTEGTGYAPFIFYSTGTGKSSRTNALLQPLTLLSFERNARTGTELQHLKEPVNTHPFSSIPFDPQKSGIAMFLSEFLTHALRNENEGAKTIYAFLKDTILELDNSASVWNLHIYTMLRVAEFIGIGPNTDQYSPGCLFDLQSGTFQAAQPAHAYYMEPDKAYKAAMLLQCDDAAATGLIPLTGMERASLLASLNTYYRLHLPGFPVLKSIEILQTMFS